MLYESCFERCEDHAAVTFVRLVQIPDHDVAIATVETAKREGLGRGNCRNCDTRAPEVFTEAAGVLLLLVLVDAVDPQAVGEALARQQHAQAVALAGAAGPVPAHVSVLV